MVRSRRRGNAAGPHRADEAVVHSVAGELDIADDRDRNAQEYLVPLAVRLLDLLQDGVVPPGIFHAYMIRQPRFFFMRAQADAEPAI